MPDSSIPLEQMTIGQLEELNLDELRDICLLYTSRGV